jgi:parallel beta-helix repeat protein
VRAGQLGSSRPAFQPLAAAYVASIYLDLCESLRGRQLIACDFQCHGHVFNSGCCTGLPHHPYCTIMIARISAACLAACMSSAVAIPAAAAVTGPAFASPAFGVATGAAGAAGATFVVTNLMSSGPGSLRAAINAADAAPAQAAVINFSVRGVITLASTLPAVTSKVTIDARTAPGHVRGGAPVVEIDCHGHGGLWFAAGSAGSRLLGAAVDGASGNGVTLEAGAITLNSDYVGLSLAGTRAGNGAAGVYAAATSAGNVLGVNASGAAGVVANVVSGNAGSGIVLSGSSGNVVVANRIGTNARGTARIGNGGNGITLTRGASGNEIGGTAFTDTATGQVNNPTGDKGTVPPVFVVPPLGNLISGNTRNGVLIHAGSRNNTLNGNFVGTTSNGDAAIGNGGNGVWIDRASGNSLVGCKFVNNPFVYYNVLSGNGRNGLRITSSNHVVVQGNFLGVGANNTAIAANRLDGIRVDGSSAHTQVGGVIPLGNVSAGNGRNGIEVAGTARGFITFNTFGGLLAFKGAAPNGRNGLLVTSTGGDNVARTNVFSGNRRNGIELAGRARGVSIEPDIAGLATNGMSALPNGGDGLLITGRARDNVIGGSRRSVIPQNTFSANGGYGIAVLARAHHNLIFSDFIGTKLLGLTALGNRKGGILIGGHAYANVVGSLATPANLISGNTGNGVTVRAGTRRNVVINNYVGLDRRGRPLRNTGRAIVNRGRHNIIRHNHSRPPRG